MLAASDKEDLWGAAYLINGGCSDDGFDHFRGWLMTQGREVFARAVAEPDSLAELPQVRAAALSGAEFEAEEMLSVPLGRVPEGHRRPTAGGPRPGAGAGPQRLLGLRRRGRGAPPAAPAGRALPGAADGVRGPSGRDRQSPAQRAHPGGVGT